MSTAALEVGGNTPGLLLSASQVDRLASCEMRWLLDKTMPPGPESAKSEALLLGTLMHRLMGAWWQGRPWQQEWDTALAEEDGWEPGYEAPTVFNRAVKIMAAWVEVHGLTPPYPLVALELPFDLPVPGLKDVRIRAFIDGLVTVPADGTRPDDRRKDTLRLLEFKTMGRWGRETMVPWDPQLHLYLWAARQLFNADGAIFEAISTYDYKTGGAERRFKRIDLPYDERAVARTLDDVRTAAKRARLLLKTPALAVRNITKDCSWCPHFKQCLTPWETG